MYKFLRGKFLGFWGSLHPVRPPLLLEAGTLHHFSILHHPKWIHAVAFHGPREHFRLQLVLGFQEGAREHREKVRGFLIPELLPGLGPDEDYVEMMLWGFVLVEA